MLFPERAELEQDTDVHEAEEGNADAASDRGLKRQQPDPSRTGSWVNSARPDGLERTLTNVGTKSWVGTCQYSFAAQMTTRAPQLRWRTQKYSAS